MWLVSLYNAYDCAVFKFQDNCTHKHGPIVRVIVIFMFKNLIKSNSDLL